MIDAPSVIMLATHADNLVHEVNILAQEDGGWGRLAYLLIFLVLPALKSLGVWLRNRFGEKDDGAEKAKEPAQESRKPLKRRARRDPVIATPTEKRIPRAIPVTEESPPPMARPAASVRGRPPMPKRPVRRRRSESPPQVEQSTDVRRQRLSAIATILEKSTKQERKAPPTAPVPGKRPSLPKRFDKAAMRSAIILSEVLQPPLAIRRDETDRSA